MRFLSHLQVGTKLALVMTCILALVSLGIYLYFPARMQRQAIEALTQRASAIADVTAFGVAPGLENRNPVAVAAAVIALRRNPDLVFFVVKDQPGKTFASFNEMVAASAGPFATAPQSRSSRQPVITGMPAGEQSETVGAISSDGSLYQTTTPIRYRGKGIGSLVIGFSLERVLIQTSRSRATVALGKDEVGKLARSFNLMLDRLSAAREELEMLNLTLEQRVEERARELTEEITGRRRAQERYRLLFERNLAGVYIASVDGKIISCNDACARLFRFEFAEDFLAADGAIRYMNARHRDVVMRRLVANGAVFNEEVELRDRNGEAVWALENVRLVPGDGGKEATLEGILLDINDRKRAEGDITFRAYHDELTSLPNRALFLDRVGVAMANVQRKKRRLAVLFLDLDELKVVNDTLGHDVGDALLKMVASRLTDALRQGDTVARVGGDEFVILLPEISHESDAQRASQKILKTIGKPFVLESDELHITASIGLAIGPRDGATPESLIRNADGAMYLAKQSGGNRCELYRDVGPGIIGRTAQEAELRLAIDRDEFVMHFQPQVTIDSRELVGVEALVRWNHAERGMIEPSAFIPLTEHTGLITVLGEVVLRKACEQGMAWQREGCIVPRIAVNVSPRQLYQRDFVGMVTRVLKVTGFNPQLLELELTESMVIQKSDRSRAILKSLRAMGIAIAVDDFGTGQSSLSYVKQFAVDTVKIDRSFVIDVVRKKSDQSIVSAVLMVANQLRLRTIAEGVETDEQCAFLHQHGCREIQGYMISRPLPADRLQRTFLRSATTRAAV